MRWIVYYDNSLILFCEVNLLQFNGYSALPTTESNVKMVHAKQSDMRHLAGVAAKGLQDNSIFNRASFTLTHPHPLQYSNANVDPQLVHSGFCESPNSSHCLHPLVHKIVDPYLIESRLRLRQIEALLYAAKVNSLKLDEDTDLLVFSDKHTAVCKTDLMLVCHIHGLAHLSLVQNEQN